MTRSFSDRATFEALARARRHRSGPIWLRCAPAHALDAARTRALSGSAPVPGPRVAYAVGRSVGGAVERNRVRRRLRAAVARHEHELTDGSAYLFGAEPRVVHLPFETLDRAVGELLRAVREVEV